MNEYKTAADFLGCAQCSSTTYLSFNHCCPTGEQWDKVTKACKTMDPTDNCSQRNDTQFCIKCKDDTISYLSNFSATQ